VSRHRYARVRWVNAAGLRVAKVTDQTIGQASAKQIGWWHGQSHIVCSGGMNMRASTPTILQNSDRRIVFVIPMTDFSLIGHDDVDYSGRPSGQQFNQETDYLLAVGHSLFARRSSAADYVWAFSGVRPLWIESRPLRKQPQRRLQFDAGRIPRKAPLLSYSGGKITTYRANWPSAVNKPEQPIPQDAGPRNDPQANPCWRVTSEP